MHDRIIDPDLKSVDEAVRKVLCRSSKPIQICSQSNSLDVGFLLRRAMTRRPMKVHRSAARGRSTGCHRGTHGLKKLSTKHF
jgi:hypothetical protein